jgi:hypothetical protein
MTWQKLSMSFFRELPPMTRFSSLVDNEMFHRAPDDWLVVIADIVSSTRAVQAGRYKDVNTIGGAVISAALNVAGHNKIPFVFGGDGATMLIPPEVRRVVTEALVRTRTLARDDFSLELRVGFVEISVIRQRGKDVLVARYEVSPGNNLAMFNGGGVELADQLVKENTPQYALAQYELPGAPDLSGLSCRWEPLRSQKGNIVCLLVRPRSEDPVARRAALLNVLEGLSKILGDDFVQASPVSAVAMRFRWPPKGLVAEARATRGAKSFARRYLEVLTGSFVQLILERLNAKGGAYDAPLYREELRNNSDYCRFDDVLRMVLDCTFGQIEALKTLLSEIHDAGNVDYGVFEVQQALMTCLLFSLDESHHLHFVDGDEGGFWSAAEQLKGQIAERDAPVAST